MIVADLFLPHPGGMQVTVEPLTREAFSPYGDVISNPLPRNTMPVDTDASDLSHGARRMNNGNVIQYTEMTFMRDLYVNGTPRMMFSVLTPQHDVPRKTSGNTSTEISIPVLERHPFTTQTFIPLSTDNSKYYIVMVAPSLESWDMAGGLDVSYPSQAQRHQNKEAYNLLPSKGGPDVGKIRAFIANMDQGVTYRPGTWHSPMVALGPTKSTVDFVVVQFANDVPMDDLQQVSLQGQKGDIGSGFSVCIKAL